MSGFQIYSPVIKSPYLFQICFSAHSMVFVALSCCSNAVDSKQALIQESKSPSIPHSCSFTHGWLAAAFVNNYKVPGRKRSCVGGISVWPWPCIRTSPLPSRPFINRSLRALRLSMCNKCLWDGFWIMTKKAHCTTALDKGKKWKNMNMHDVHCEVHVNVSSWKLNYLQQRSLDIALSDVHGKNVDMHTDKMS